MVYFIYNEVLVIRKWIVTYVHDCYKVRQRVLRKELVSVQLVRIYLESYPILLRYRVRNGKMPFWRISKIFSESNVCRCKPGFYCGMNIMTVYLKLWYVITVVKIGDKLQPCTAVCCLVYGQMTWFRNFV